MQLRTASRRYDTSALDDGDEDDGREAHHSIEPTQAESDARIAARVERAAEQHGITGDPNQFQPGDERLKGRAAFDLQASVNSWMAQLELPQGEEDHLVASCASPQDCNDLSVSLSATSARLGSSIATTETANGSSTASFSSFRVSPNGSQRSASPQASSTRGPGQKQQFAPNWDGDTLALLTYAPMSDADGQPHPMGVPDS